ncbi:MAG: Metal dependent phosphohydrolase, HD region [uncultured Solirubrobacterales bacterium]|uniref:Metal dependent phosphohydrolase, HD region n=1 Tax=uncultured Solirubrobacterales bacterium TaxID=768556 RepID=A0A6J4RWJ6_9ACTN|nr:MAG: Metal dependent phosphohydrolase, HD region [uncultured Solirubrobacterales bacterium]
MDEGRREADAALLRDAGKTSAEGDDLYAGELAVRLFEQHAHALRRALEILGRGDAGDHHAPVAAKPDYAAAEERAQGPLHPRREVEALMALLPGVADAGLYEEAHWVLHHHERLNGTGYPDGLVGEAIPLESRIILVADAFEAMTSDRPYRRGRDERAALDELQRCAGTQFDPNCVAALGRALRRDARWLSESSARGGVKSVA